MRRQAGVLFLLKLIKIPLNILLLSITAKYYGVSIEKDVWLLAFTTISVIDLAIWGPINETFRTKFIIFKETQSTELAIQKTQSLITYFVLFSLLMIAIIIAIPNTFSQIIAPSYNTIQREILVRMLYFVAPLLLFNQLMQIGLSILNAYEIFNIPEIASFFSTLINILLLICFAKQLNIYALVISQYVSVIILILFIIYFLYKKNIRLITMSNWNYKFEGFKTFFLFALPFFFPYFFGQINGIIEKILAGKLGQGTISILDFSNRIPNLLYGIIVSIITTILVPVLSSSFLKNDVEKFNGEFRKMFQLGILVIGLIVAFICGASLPIALLLYDKGTIDYQSLLSISRLSIFYAVSLIGIFFYVIFGMSLLSSQNQKHYAIMGVLTQITVVTLNFVFYKVFGKYTFPLSIFISHLFFGLLMFRKYPYRYTLKLNFFKYLSLIIFLSLVIYFISRFIFIEDNLLKITIVTSIMLSLFLLLCAIFNIEEKTLLIDFIGKKITTRNKND